MTDTSPRPEPIPWTRRPDDEDIAFATSPAGIARVTIHRRSP